MPIIVGLFWVYVRSLLTLLAFRSAASGAPKECFKLVNLQAGSVIATVEVSAGMYPPPHMTSIYLFISRETGYGKSSLALPQAFILLLI